MKETRITARIDSHRKELIAMKQIELGLEKESDVVRLALDEFLTKDVTDENILLSKIESQKKQLDKLESSVKSLSLVLSELVTLSFMNHPLDSYGWKRKMDEGEVEGFIDRINIAYGIASRQEEMLWANIRNNEKNKALVMKLLADLVEESAE